MRYPLKESQKDIIKHTRRQAHYTLGVFIVTTITYITTTIFTSTQLQKSNITSDTTFAKMQRVINSLEISDSISKVALGNAEKSFEIDNRAFLGIDDFPNENYNNVYGFYVIIRNFGRTPAYFTYTMGQKDTTEKAFTKHIYQYIDTAKLEYITKIKPQNIVVGSGQPHTIIFNHPMQNISPSINALYMSGMVNRFIWGNIMYKDFFGKQHYVHFCGVLDWSTNVFTPIGKYNDAN